MFEDEQNDDFVSQAMLLGRIQNKSFPQKYLMEEIRTIEQTKSLRLPLTSRMNVITMSQSNLLYTF